VRDGQDVGPGDTMLAHPAVEGQKTRDITGGLPRVADLFEARKPEGHRPSWPRPGTVSFGKDTKGKQRLVIRTDKNDEIETLIPKWRHEHRCSRASMSRRATSFVDGAPDSARHPAPEGRARADPLHRQRGAGGLPPAGREDQRQAHRGHRPADAAQG
jgi:hypothetical protein